MRTIVLVGSDVETTRLGFGLAHLLRAPTRRERQALLAAAYDAGIRHFDVARMYGLGMAERELGRFARGRRDDIVIATKFGIEVGGMARRLAPVQAPARWLLRRLRGDRPAAGVHRGGAAEPRPPRVYDGATARASLETSLRELGTDHVDVLFLHEPDTTDDVRVDDVCATLESLRDAGKIRAWGVSGEPAPSAELLGGFGRPAVLQVRHDLVAPVAPGPAAVFGVVAGALGLVVTRAREDGDFRARWREATGADLAMPEEAAALLLREALASHPQATVVFSTTRADRIAPAARAAELDGRPGDPALEALRRLAADELSPNAS